LLQWSKQWTNRSGLKVHANELLRITSYRKFVPRDLGPCHVIWGQVLQSHIVVIQA
jgi:hypothetical protein